MRNLPVLVLRAVNQGLRLVIRAYQLLLSPWLGNNCRFYPTCSVYSREALARHGVVRGLWLSVWRIARCNSLSEGGFEPVPGCLVPGASRDECAKDCAPR